MPVFSFLAMLCDYNTKVKEILEDKK
jgi:hypothetical protein